jgi:hypothetical protein
MNQFAPHSCMSFRLSPAIRIGLWLFLLCVWAPAAQAAQTLGQVTQKLYTDFLPVQVFLSSIIFLLGIWYSIKGVQMLRATGEGGQNAPALSASLFKLFGGAALIVIPFAINVLVNTLSSGNLGAKSIQQSGILASDAPTFDGPGLDEAVGRFVIDFFYPFMSDALPYFCYIAGVLLLVRGFQRVANGDEKGPKAPGGLGTWMLFFVAAALMSMGYFMQVLQCSIFGTNMLYGSVKLMDQSILSQRAENVLWAVFQFLRIVGYISVIRGLFMLKGFAEGANNASLLGSSTHIISGAMLANVFFYVNVIQNTFVSDTAYHVFNGAGLSGAGC